MKHQRFVVSVFVLALGVAIQFGTLALADRLVPTFPSVYDVTFDVLPRLDFSYIGELFFFLFLALFAIIFFRQPQRDLSSLLIQLGIFYAIRGIFMLLLPIGSPEGTGSVGDRFLLYPYASHAYFPGGHVGIMLLMSLALQRRFLRVGFVVFTILFGFGSMLARAHYAADILAGLLLAYGIVLWREKRAASEKK
jgi:membrane-associated phospholipid phosphatase